MGFRLSQLLGSLILVTLPLQGGVLHAGPAENPKFMDVPALIRTLQDNADISGNVTLGIAAREELARRGREDPQVVVPSLIAELEKPRARDRKASAARIAIMGVLQDVGPGAEEAVQILQTIATDPQERNDWIKSQAQAALASIGTPKARESARQSQQAEFEQWQQRASAADIKQAVREHAYLIERELRQVEPREEMILASLEILELVGAPARAAAPALRRLLADQRLGQPLRRRVTALADRLGIKDGKSVAAPEALEALRADLRSGDALVVSLAMEELGRMGPSEQVLAILSAALRDGIDPGNAARLLGEFGPKAAAAVSLILPYVWREDTAPNALQALGRIGVDQPGVAEAVVAVLSDPGSPHRGQAAHAAGVLRLSQAVPALIQTLTDPRKYTRILAINALGRMAPNDDKGQSQAIVSALVPLLEVTDREVRLATLEALGTHGEAAQPVAAAIARQLDEPDSRLQQAATRALEHIGGTTARQSLEARALRFTEADLARYGALRRAGDEAGLERFLRALPSARQVVVARAMLQEDDVQIAYFGASLLIRHGHEAETFSALVRIIATGGNDPSGPLHGRMGYDWVHSDDTELAGRMVQGIADHAGANLDTYPPDQRQRLEDFLKAGN